MSTVRAIEIFKDSRVTLIALESVDFRHHQTNSNCQLHGNIKPVAVIVCGSDRSYALDMEGKPVKLDQLRQDVSGLDTIVK